MFTIIEPPHQARSSVAYQATDVPPPRQRPYDHRFVKLKTSNISRHKFISRADRGDVRLRRIGEMVAFNSRQITHQCFVPGPYQPHYTSAASNAKPTCNDSRISCTVGRVMLFSTTEIL